MSITTATRSVPFGAITTFRLVHAIENAAEAFASWKAARQTRGALANLSDSQLEDIGLVRADADMIYNKIRSGRY
ncbi:DUF1127 domain-containing protein [Pseudohalocynthiibacter aestuariivivens]|jgi:uncharacterized protein YjiS (DUF1127 family)|uniref:DUF1127 domain-containing protein n=1 Tax=Pseudohalocynthiibacter aestuariivivens TaxID=1591409 RepID=A0ABV5JLE6_9RHOB|nr:MULTISPECIES: DUF1127 domain-containing protein [Pseudohalocynthiibacter]MBS9717581.1 DUF1127 domain-containing protein [Pseudohalocynthiibacter aestuariivivens]MCK0102779.1 DUF1127 domain-containing protein [Pseudohalocynthiibacter sp. F2068]